MTENEMLQRTKNFALRIIKIVNALPNNAAGRTIGNQFVRSGTSVAANYRAACRGRSKAEFIAKLGIVEEEADESGLWRELLGESELMKPNVLSDLIQEARELTAIMSAAKITARKQK